MSTKTETTLHLEQVIETTLTYLESLSPDSDEFAKTVDQLTKLNELLPKKEPLMKSDTLAGIFGNLAGIVTILAYEQSGHVIASKALGFVIKPRF